MNIQIFGKSKCFDTKKAERYFKERKIKVQSVDILQKGLSKGELNSVKQAVGGIENLVDPNCKDKEEKLLENPKLLKTPIVRNGKKATVGYQPDVWKQWE